MIAYHSDEENDANDYVDPECGQMRFVVPRTDVGKYDDISEIT